MNDKERQAWILDNSVKIFTEMYRRADGRLSDRQYARHAVGIAAYMLLYAEEEHGCCPEPAHGGIPIEEIPLDVINALPDLSDDEKDLLAKGRKIDCIKAIRTRLGVSLVEAKRHLENLLREDGVE